MIGLAAFVTLFTAICVTLTFMALHVALESVSKDPMDILAVIFAMIFVFIVAYFSGVLIIDVWRTTWLLLWD